MKLFFGKTIYHLIQTNGINPEPIINVLFTILTSILILIAYWIYKYGIKSNTYYKDTDKPLLIGIAGDSGVGKTTITQVIKDLTGEEFTTIINGDDAHKWERNDKNWEKYTHLNPNSNNLHNEIDTLKELKDGRPINRKLYDHITGKFTEPKSVKPKSFMILEGLHSFYIHSVRNLCDIRIFIDTDDALRKHWKIQRDIKERGYEKEKILETINKRQKDSDKYIPPQKKFANIIISLNPQIPIKDLDSKNNVELFLNIKIENSVDLNPFISLLEHTNMKCENEFEEDLIMQTLRFKGKITSDEISKIANKILPNYDNIILNNKIKWHSDYNGIIQLITLYHINNQLKDKLEQ